MKKIVMSAGVSATMFAATVVPAFAAGTPNQQSCFGQDRAAWISANSGREAGAIISQRAGDNAQINHDYMAACQA